MKRRGISRIDQPYTRTYGWFVRADFYRRRDGSYVPRYRKFFGDVGGSGAHCGPRESTWPRSRAPGAPRRAKKPAR